MFKRRNPLDEPGAVKMTAHELAIRFKTGQRFRLVCLPYTFPRTFPPRYGDQWPRIIEAGFAADPGRPVVGIAIERQADAYSACPGDHVIVIPV
jgi:hypothetical protein